MLLQEFRLSVLQRLGMEAYRLTSPNGPRDHTPTKCTLPHGERSLADRSIMRYPQHARMLLCQHLTSRDLNR